MRATDAETGETQTVELDSCPELALPVAFALLGGAETAGNTSSVGDRLVFSALSALLESCRGDAAEEQVAGACTGAWVGGRSLPASGAKLVGLLTGPGVVIARLLEELPPGALQEEGCLWTPWLRLLRCIGDLAQGRCTECNTEWAWQHDDGVRSVEFSDPLADAAQPTPDLELQAAKICHASSDWLMQNCSTFSPWQTMPVDGTTAADLAARSAGTVFPAAEPGSFLEMLSHGVCWEVAEDPMPQQLGQTVWWPCLQTQWPKATPMLLGLQPFLAVGCVESRVLKPCDIQCKLR